MKKIKYFLLAAALMSLLSVSFASTLPIFSIMGSLGSDSGVAESAGISIQVAGILFASVLLVAGSLGRRKKKSKKTLMVGAFTRVN